MDDFPIMNMLHTQANLCEPVQDLSLWEWSAFLIFASVLKVTTITVVHYDTEFASPSLEYLYEGDNIWVAKGFQKTRFLECLLLLAFWHSTDVNHLHYAHIAIVYTSHQESLAEWAFAQEFDFLIGLKLWALFYALHLLLNHLCLKIRVSWQNLNIFNSLKV